MPRRKRLDFFLNLGHLLDHLTMLIFPTAVLAIGTAWQRPYGELLPLALGGFIAFGAFSIPAGWLADRWSRRGMMLAFFFGIGIATLVTGLARTPAEMALGLDGDRYVRSDLSPRRNHDAGLERGEHFPSRRGRSDEPRRSRSYARRERGLGKCRACVRRAPERPSRRARRMACGILRAGARLHRGGLRLFLGEPRHRRREARGEERWRPAAAGAARARLLRRGHRHGMRRPYLQCNHRVDAKGVRRAPQSTHRNDIRRRDAGLHHLPDRRDGAAPRRIVDRSPLAERRVRRGGGIASAAARSQRGRLPITRCSRLRSR